VFRILSRFLKSDIERYDPNSLHAFEREILTQVIRQKHHNVLFMSLREQLKLILRLKTTQLPGLPNWLRRESTTETITVKQLRNVGGWQGPPPRSDDTIFAFQISLRDVTSGRFEILMTQSIEEFRWCPNSPTAAYPDSGAFDVIPQKIADERDYWEHRQELLPPISVMVCESVEQGQFSDDLVIPNPVAFGGSSVCGLRLANSYHRLLKFADGIRVNKLTLIGSLEIATRRFSEGGSQYLAIGEDEEYSYALRESDGVLADEVFRFKHRSATAKGCGLDVHGLMSQALKSTR
jgi:hypothetical protein